MSRCKKRWFAVEARVESKYAHKRGGIRLYAASILACSKTAAKARGRQRAGALPRGTRWTVRAE